MSLKALVILILVLPFALTSVTASEELNISIRFPDFYNSCALGCEDIGRVGYTYIGIVTVEALMEEVNLTQKFLNIECSPTKIENFDIYRTVYLYNGLECVAIVDEINLADKLGKVSLSKGEREDFFIYIYFCEPGLHQLKWKEKQETKWWIMSISILTQQEYEMLPRDESMRSILLVVGTIIAMIIGILAGVIKLYPYSRDWIKRPKLEVEPDVRKLPNDIRLELKVKNKGKNTAKNVGGKVIKGRRKGVPIMWKQGTIVYSGNELTEIDIDPDTMKISHPIKFCNDVITIELYWDYKGDKKKKTYEFPCDGFEKEL